MRTFATGATRDTEVEKLDYEGFLSPVVLKAYAEYMHTNRLQADGSLRSADNWQKGMPLTVYMKSAWRHFHEVWTLHRNPPQHNEVLVRALCALLFNVMGYLHETLMIRSANYPARSVQLELPFDD